MTRAIILVKLNIIKSSELKVLTWNVADGLSDETRALGIAEIVAEHDPDIAVFQEGATHGRALMSAATRLLTTEVGQVYAHNYNDSDKRKDRHQLVAVAKPHISAPKIRAALHRPAMLFTTNEFEVLGMHGLDRHGFWPDDPEEARLRQMRHHLSYHLGMKDDRTSVILTDENEIHAEDTIAGYLRYARPFAERLPSKDPGEFPSKLERFGSLSQRLTSYAFSAGLCLAEEYGFKDADPKHRPTKFASIKGFDVLSVQLDRILVRNGSAEQPELIRTDLADHSAVVTTVTSPGRLPIVIDLAASLRVQIDRTGSDEAP